MRSGAWQGLRSWTPGVDEPTVAAVNARTGGLIASARGAADDRADARAHAGPYGRDPGRSPTTRRSRISMLREGAGRGAGPAAGVKSRRTPPSPAPPLTPTRYGVLVFQPLNSTVPRAPVPPFAAVMKIPASCAAVAPGAVTVATFRQVVPSSVDSSPV
ncbi:Transcription elongation factor SPT6 [Streptomyces hygroscopicus]|nr:Transcription elongation factor SPT6 [Streptomyces hygroscopicus]